MHQATTDMQANINMMQETFLTPSTLIPQVTWRKDSVDNSWKFYSKGDIFENGASFIQTGLGGAKPYYNSEQNFRVVDAKSVRSSTRASGALTCTKKSRC